jgi:hypothetical protein
MIALLQDSASAVAPSAVDSVVDKTLLPDPITPIIQWIFQRPPWVMWGGVLLAAGIVFLVLRWLWPRRAAMRGWITTRSVGIKVAMVAALGLVGLLAAGFGYKSYHFVETDRRFCNGCHIFVSSGQSMEHPDTGFYSMVPRLEGKHDTISCHTCHPLKPMKEAVKLVFWMSGVRGKEIPPHGKVPRAICEQCHVQGSAKQTWQAIAATAGHRTHLESDSSALKGKVQCLTCHARTAHRFLPADSTCVQQGCHLTGETKIVLGAMTDVSELHCTVCHQFTTMVPALATRDSAAGALRPNFRQCFSCHRMETLLPGFATEKDPHNGTCGMCHNPHTQQSKTGAVTSCTDAKCHADWRKQPFHVGANHRKVATDCTLCHNQHAARVDGSACAECHEAVRSNPRVHLRPPLPFDTTKALQHSVVPIIPPPAATRQERPIRGKGDAPPGDDDDPGGPGNPVPPAPADSFSHPIHKKLACLTCHLSKSGAKLTFEPPRGCQICHHEAQEKKSCNDCHTTDALDAAIEVNVSVTVPKHPARVRTVGYRHQVHHDKQCRDCHTTQVSLEPADSVTGCTGCHTDHHQSGRSCATCHRTDAISQPHARADVTHMGCDACHTPARIAELEPTRSFCLVCHDPKQDHHEGKECSECHFLSSPAEFREHLVSQRGAE